MSLFFCNENGRTSSTHLCSRKFLHSCGSIRRPKRRRGSRHPCSGMWASHVPAARLFALLTVLVAVLVLLARGARGTATERSHVRPLFNSEDDGVVFARLRVLVAEGSAVRRAPASVDLAGGGCLSGNTEGGKSAEGRHSTFIRPIMPRKARLSLVAECDREPRIIMRGIAGHSIFHSLS